ncbi:MAG: hypothetical protein ABH829_03870 [archaeon]
MKKYLPLLALVLVLGCIETAPSGPQYTGTRTGLVITQFEPESSEFQGTGTETFEVFLELQNVGDSLASNIHAEVLNFEDFIGTTTAELGSLDPPSDVSEGEVQDYSFIFTIPKRELGLRDVVTLTGRIQYDYTSFGRVDVPVVPKAEWDAKKDLGLTNYPLEMSSSEGPLLVTIQSTKNPVIVSDRFDTFTISVDIENIGNGAVRSQQYSYVDGGYDIMDAVDLIVPAGFEIGEYCDFSGTLGAGGGLLTLQLDPQRLQLLSGKHRSLTCRLRALNKDTENTYEFTAVARYRYQIDEYATIVIIGTQTI